LLQRFWIVVLVGGFHTSTLAVLAILSSILLP
jgi:hypothetical protein